MEAADRSLQQELNLIPSLWPFFGSVLRSCAYIIPKMGPVGVFSIVIGTKVGMPDHFSKDCSCHKDGAY
jgi:hypothetical protein